MTSYFFFSKYSRYLRSLKIASVLETERRLEDQANNKVLFVQQKQTRDNYKYYSYSNCYFCSKYFDCFC